MCDRCVFAGDDTDVRLKLNPCIVFSVPAEFRKPRLPKGDRKLSVRSEPETPSAE